jgi:hypothetical protein
MTKVEKRITGFSVVTPQEKQAEQLHERMARPEVLAGSTYRIKTPLSDHALYITINDIILNEGTPDESRRPFEVFVNCRAMEHFQWIVALTRIMSAVFRKGGEVAFLVEELRSVFDPKGGYFKPGGRFMPSLVAEIGDVLEQHLLGLRMMTRDDSLAKAAQAMVAAKQATSDPHPMVDAEQDEPAGFPADAALCAKCQTKAAVLLDGCLTCLFCGDSKCG